MTNREILYNDLRKSAKVLDTYIETTKHIREMHKSDFTSSMNLADSLLETTKNHQELQCEYTVSLVNIVLYSLISVDTLITLRQVDTVSKGEDLNNILQPLIFSLAYKAYNVSESLYESLDILSSILTSNTNTPQLINTMFILNQLTIQYGVVS